MELKFDMPKVKASIIKVLGVGGGGGNAVNHMFKQGIKGVDFIICNTDNQALEQSPIPNKIQLGSNLTEGRGAGSNPEVGKKAALETIEDIKKVLSTNTKMLFITAGMGGGTGTGAAPIIAQTAREMGILTVGIVTTPFTFEGNKRRSRASEGIDELANNVDTLLVISNEKLRAMFGNLSLSNAFSHADNILAGAAKGIAEIITVPGYINVDFEDVKTVMANSGAAIMGSAVAEGEDRAQKAVENAISSPLLSDNDIKGAKFILLNISSGKKEVLMDEITTITDYIQEAAGHDVDMIWGNCFDESLGEKLSVTIIATAFEKRKGRGGNHVKNSVSTTGTESAGRDADEKDEPRRKVVHTLHDDPDEFPTEEEIMQRTNEQMQLEFEEQNKEEDTEPHLISSTNKAKEADKSDQEKKEEIQRLRSLSFNIKTATGLSELEKEPAYVRKNVKFRKVPHSSDTEISRFTLTEDKKDQKPEIKQNNRFLHDNVD